MCVCVWNNKHFSHPWHTTHLRHSLSFYRFGFRIVARNLESRNAWHNKRSRITTQRRRMAWKTVRITRVDRCKREIRRQKILNPARHFRQYQQHRIPVHHRIIRTGILSQLMVISLVFFFSCFHLNWNFVYPIKSRLQIYSLHALL